MDWKSIRRVLPVGATYALGDLMDLAAARNVSGTTLMVAAQLRLPLCALLRWGLLGRNQTKLQQLGALHSQNRAQVAAALGHLHPLPGPCHA